MTDALMDRIKAHRSAPDVYDPPTFDQMADRIEELVKERDEARIAINQIGEALGVLGIVQCLDDIVAEAKKRFAKLAKAVAALKFYAPQTVGGITFVGGDDAGKRASAALAELEKM